MDIGLLELQEHKEKYPTHVIDILLFVNVILKNSGHCMAN